MLDLRTFRRRHHAVIIRTAFAWEDDLCAAHAADVLQRFQRLRVHLLIKLLNHTAAAICPRLRRDLLRLGAERILRLLVRHDIDAWEALRRHAEMAHGDIEQHAAVRRRADDVRHDVDAVLGRRPIAVEDAAIAEVFLLHVLRQRASLVEAVGITDRRLLRMTRLLARLLRLPLRLALRCLRILLRLHGGLRILIMMRGKITGRARTAEEDDAQEHAPDDLHDSLELARPPRGPSPLLSRHAPCSLPQTPDFNIISCFYYTPSARFFLFFSRQKVFLEKPCRP